MDGIVFIALNPPGLETAQKARAALGYGEIHGLSLIHISEPTRPY